MRPMKRHMAGNRCQIPFIVAAVITLARFIALVADSLHQILYIHYLSLLGKVFSSTFVHPPPYQ